MLKRMFIFPLITIFLLSSLTGCGQSQAASTKSGQQQEQPIEISFVNSVTAEEATKQVSLDVIKEFERLNPNIKIKNIPIPISEELNQLTIMSTGGNAPDVAQAHGDNIIALAAMGALSPLEDVLSKDFLNDVNKNAYDLGIYKGKHYSVPWIGNPLGFWYNKKIMKDAGLDPNKPPQTMDELNSAMATIKAKFPDVVGLQLDTTIRTLGLEHEWAFMKTFGTPPIVQDKDGDKITASQMGPYLEWVRSLVKNGYTLPGKKFGEFRPMAAQNRLAFGFDSPFFKGTVMSLDKNLTPEKFYEIWGVTTLPIGASKTAFSAPDDNNLTIFAASKHKEAAAKFAEFFASSDFALKNFHFTKGFLPLVKSAQTRFPNEFADPATKIFFEKISGIVAPLPWGPNFAKSATVIMAGVQDSITSDRPIPDIVKDMQTKLEGVAKGQ